MVPNIPVTMFTSPPSILVTTSTVPDIKLPNCLKGHDTIFHMVPNIPVTMFTSPPSILVTTSTVPDIKLPIILKGHDMISHTVPNTFLTVSIKPDTTSPTNPNTVPTIFPNPSNASDIPGMAKVGNSLSPLANNHMAPPSKPMATAVMPMKGAISTNAAAPIDSAVNTTEPISTSPQLTPVNSLNALPATIMAPPSNPTATIPSNT